MARSMRHLVGAILAVAVILAPPALGDEPAELTPLAFDGPPLPRAEAGSTAVEVLEGEPPIVEESVPGEILIGAEGDANDFFSGEAPAPVVSSGNWYSCGAWYFDGSGMLVQRTKPREIQITTGRFQTFQGIAFPIADEVLSTRTMVIHAEPGGKFTIGKYLYRDIINRDISAELTYQAVDDFSAHADAVGRRVTDSGGTFGSLISAFPLNVGGFTGADLHHIEYSSEVHSFEANLRVRRRLERDRMVLQPDGSWRHEMTPGQVPSFFAGLRYMQVDEQFDFFSQGVLAFLAQPVETMTADYRVNTTNDLYGLQMGADWIEQHARFSMGTHVKAGGFLNYARQTTSITINDPTNPTPGRFDVGTDESFAFVGEFGLMVAYHVTPRLKVHASYDFMWVASIALAPEQLVFDDVDAPIKLNDGGHISYQGVSLGAEWNW